MKRYLIKLEIIKLSTNRKFTRYELVLAESKQQAANLAKNKYSKKGTRIRLLNV